MSDSSEDEDLSRFKEVVDASFTNLLHSTAAKPASERQKPKSERFLVESSHYNDVKVPEKMQNQIGTKISTIINQSFEFIEVEPQKIKKPKTKGGVKLFKTSEGFLSSEQVKDVSTELHNIESRKINKKRRQIDNEPEINENEKILQVAVSGDQILAKDDTKLWKSRRKEKIFKYKAQGKSKVLVTID